MDLPSTKPYLVRAIHQWCCDNGFTPYIAVVADEHARVPREFVIDGRIVLNVSYEATGQLSIGNELISFKARFAGVSRDISVPMANVAAIYAKESGAGMAFEPETAAPGSGPGGKGSDDPEPPPAPAGRPRLQRIK